MDEGGAAFYGPKISVQAKDDAVSFRYRDGTQKNGVPVLQAVLEIANAIEDRLQI